MLYSFPTCTKQCCASHQLLFSQTEASPTKRRSPTPSLHPSPPQASFVADDVNNIIKESIDSVLQNASYNHNKVRATFLPAPRPTERSACLKPPLNTTGAKMV